MRKYSFPGFMSCVTLRTNISISMTILSIRSYILFKLRYKMSTRNLDFTGQAFKIAILIAKNLFKNYFDNK